MLSVPAEHDLAFAELLRECGLLPQQVTLKIDHEGVEGTDHIAHLRRAVANYKARRNGIAISRFGHASNDFALFESLRPDIVKLIPPDSPSLLPLYPFNKSIVAAAAHRR